jgi:hypothetical protein
MAGGCVMMYLVMQHMNLFESPGSRVRTAGFFASVNPPGFPWLAGSQFPLFWLAFFFLWPASAFANNPGGFTTLVTTPVTTGTEAFGSRTDRYLDNGIPVLLTPPTIRNYSAEHTLTLDYLQNYGSAQTSGPATVERFFYDVRLGRMFYRAITN